MPPNDMKEPIVGEVLSASITVLPDDAIAAPARRLLAGIEGIVIDSDAVYEACATDLTAAKTLKARVDEDRKGLTRPLDELKAKIMDKYRPAIEICDRVIAALQPKMLAYTNAKEEAARKARLEAENAARAERERLEREAAEKRRAADEEAAALRRKAEEEAAAARQRAQEEADRLAAAGREQEAQEAKARAEHEARERAAAAEREAESRRNAAIEEARALEETAQVTTAVVTTEGAPKVAGTSVAGTWKARVIDKAALVAHIAANPALIDLLDVNESGLNQMAKAMKKNFTLPGCESYLDQTVRSRRK